MDILIKNMEMPKGNNVLVVDSAGTITKVNRWTGKVEATDPFSVNAVELLEHGRLIDADVFWKRLQKQTMVLWGEKSKAYQYFLDVMDMIKSAPTIVEASNGTDN